MQASGNEEGILKWIETGNKGDKWQETSIAIKHEEAFWVMNVFVLLFFLAFTSLKMPLITIH